VRVRLAKHDTPPRVAGVVPGSPAEHAGILPGDELVEIGGGIPGDVIEYHELTDSDAVPMRVRREGVLAEVVIDRRGGEPLGLELDAAIFDRVRTCDNHCEFCFIYQLPKGLRRSLYLKDDDYRLSFLYGNFTTLTRFTELDLERVVTENLSPLWVSIHATDPEVRSRMLRNKRGGTSLLWLRALLDRGITVHGQVVVCPGLNDGGVLDDTMAGILDEYPEMASVAVVPLGVSRYSKEPSMRAHTSEEVQAVVDLVEDWQEVFSSCLGHPMAYPADEYYLLAGRPFPGGNRYGAFAQVENGVGIARSFIESFRAAGRASSGDSPSGDSPAGSDPGEPGSDPGEPGSDPGEPGSDPGEHSRAGAGPGSMAHGGFFAWVDGAPGAGYRGARMSEERYSGRVARHAGASSRPWRGTSTRVITGRYGAQVIEPLLHEDGFSDVRVLAVENAFFGGNIAVTGLLAGQDVAKTIKADLTDESDIEHGRVRYLLPDVCLSNGRFLDGMEVEDLPSPVEIVRTDGAALREALLGESAMVAGSASTW